MNNPLIGKKLYRSNNINPFIYLNDYNPISITNNFLKIKNHLQKNSEEKDPIICVGTVTHIEYYVKYNLSKDQSVNYNGYLRPEQIYILLVTDKQYYYYSNTIEARNNKLLFIGCTYSEQEINKGWGGFNRTNVKVNLNKCNYSTSYDGNDGFAVEATAVVPFHNKSYEERFIKTITGPTNEHWLISDLIRDKSVFLENEDIAFNAINNIVKEKFLYLREMQDVFLTEFSQIKKPSSEMIFA